MSDEIDLKSVVLPPVLPPLSEEREGQADETVQDVSLTKEAETLLPSSSAEFDIQSPVIPSESEIKTPDVYSSSASENAPSLNQTTDVNSFQVPPFSQDQKAPVAETIQLSQSFQQNQVMGNMPSQPETGSDSLPQTPQSVSMHEDPIPSFFGVNQSTETSEMSVGEIQNVPQDRTKISSERPSAEQPVSESDTGVVSEVSKNQNTEGEVSPQATKAAPPQDPSMMSLAEEIDKNHEADAKEDAEKQAAAANGTETSPANEKINYSSQNFLKELFSNGNECITAPGGSYSISDSTRSMLALFSNGRYFVAETHKYDGPPLLFVTDTKRRRLQIGQPEYVPLPVINSIYEYAAQSKSKNVTEVDTGNQEQARMQRDFVTIVSKAASLHVSDIHIIVADHTTVMFRINGLMQVELEYNKEWGESFVRAAFASADISDANYAQNEYQAAQKVGKTALRGSGGKLLLPRNVQGIRLQFNPIAFGTRYVVMRLLYDEENAESAGDLSVLGFEPQETEMFYRLRAVPTGIVIVAGPTGSGKSTTLQRNMISMLQERNYELNLITVEDPPEYPIPGARQMPVTNAATEDLKDREFTKALSASLRSDPDALMIGEIRTLSAADLAFRGALSGHNVWTTLHANSAPAILMRLKDMGVEDFKLQDPSIMKGLLSQRLFRKICPYCRVSAKDQRDNPVVQRLHQAFGDIGVELSYLRGPGCKHCEFRGVKGRTVVGEFILPDATFLDLMLRGESKKALDYWVTELNGRTLKEAAQSRMLKGIIDIEEVERWTGLFNDS